MSTKYGIDVCSYQGSIDWSKCKKAGLQFAILKCIMKGLGEDKKFSSNAKGCKAQKIPFDCYTYVYENTTSGAKKRAEAAVKVLKAQGVTGCTIWWDVEDSSIRKTTSAVKASLTASIQTAQKIIEAAGYGFGVYCDTDFYKSCLNADNLDCRFWLAKYGKNPATTFGTAPTGSKPTAGKHDVCGWQYCSKGKISGISGNVDLDIAYDDHFGTTGEDDTEVVEVSGSAVTAYMVKVTADVLNIRKGPGTGYAKTGTIKDKGSYTIVAEGDGAGATKWGKLKSGAGWISLDYVKKEETKSNIVTVSGSKVTLNGRTLTVWNQHKLSGTYKTQLSKQGCGATSCAMAAVLAGADTTPEKVMALAVKKWGKPEDGHWLISCQGIVKILEDYGVSATHHLVTEDNLIKKKAIIKAALKAGHPVICWTDDNGLSGDPFSHTHHFVVAVGYDKDEKIVVANPGNKGPVNLVSLGTLTKFLYAKCADGATGWYTSVKKSAGVVVMG